MDLTGLTLLLGPSRSPAPEPGTRSRRPAPGL